MTFPPEVGIGIKEKCFRLPALAFANNSDEQKKRKHILQKFTFPHAHSDLGSTLDRLCIEECQQLIQFLNKEIEKSAKGHLVDLKPLVAKACANIFNRYFCSVQRCEYDDEAFGDYCNSFDEVFWEVNNGRAVDFLPWLMPFFKYSEPMNKMRVASKTVRNYVEENIIEPKRQMKNSNMQGR